MIYLLHEDYPTKRYQFSIDSKDELELLPKIDMPGKGTLKTIFSCCPNSRAICTNGTVYALNGDMNEWVQCASNSSGGSADVNLPDDYVFASKSDINNLFKI